MMFTFELCFVKKSPYDSFIFGFFPGDENSTRQTGRVTYNFYSPGQLASWASAKGKPCYCQIFNEIGRILHSKCFAYLGQIHSVDLRPVLRCCLLQGIQLLATTWQKRTTGELDSLQVVAP